MNLGFKSGSNF